MKNKVTMRDVAKFAGVSVATVSYVLNGVNRVSAETKSRVLEAIDTLGYAPDFTAISLSKKTSKLIGVMIPVLDGSISPMFYENPYYSEFIRGLEYTCRENGYDLIISGIGKPEDCKRWITKRNIDGLVFLGLFSDHLYEELKTLSVPMVLIDSYEEFAKFYHTIRIEDEQGGYLATKYLIDQGHQQIAYVSSGLSNNPVDHNRFLGYQKALLQHDLVVDKNLLFECSEGISLESGYQIGQTILQNKEVPTALFVAADILALGIIKSMKEQQKEVPRDYSIVGFDNLNLSQYMMPSLTTISQNIFQKGVCSGRTLIEALEGEIGPPKKVTLAVELIIRESTRSIRN
ncbi:LacI family DNA-binding transcriptional regulator [Bacillus sp. 2205SS5-2]|uniref:LacI family DNA-binding transcriptional regulator n=1 Tax=Bacillus sp. 2205SS5-2 TaxID=3109031 RepID=UPI003006D1DF